MDAFRAKVRRFITTATWHRQLLAAGLAAAAVAFAIEAASPSPPKQVEVTVAAHDLDGGTTLSAPDLANVSVPPDALPEGLLGDDAAGRVLAGPVHAGEPLTDRRVLGPELLSGWGPDVVAAPVRVADREAAGHVRHGDHIDILATSVDGTGSSTVVAGDVPVLATPLDGDTGSDGALLMVAATPGQAAELASAAVTSRLSFTLSSP